MNKKDELVLGTLAGVDIILSPKQYKEYKGTLQEQIKNLQNQLQQKDNIIKEVNELIEEYRYTNVEDYGKIIEFFKKLKTILDKENK